MAEGKPPLPWLLAEAIYREMYVLLYGREQSLERIAERGGFSYSEIEYMAGRLEDQEKNGKLGKGRNR